MTTAKVHDLLCYLKPLVSVNRSASIDDVRSKMLTEEISRVPIIDGKQRQNPRGIVRLSALFRRDALGLPSSALEDVQEKAPEAVDYEADLDVAVVKLRSAKELLIRNPEGGEHTHILTPRGLANWFHAYSRPFRVVEHLETTLRDCLLPYEGSELRALVARIDANGNPIEKVDRLNPSDYASCCVALRAKIPGMKAVSETDLRSTLVGFAERRNDLMHFRPTDQLALAADLRRFETLCALLIEARSTQPNLRRI